MPGMTGQQLLEKVGTLWPRCARLMLTADPRMKDDKSLPYRVMHKPYKLDELRTVVETLLKASPSTPAPASAGAHGASPHAQTPPGRPATGGMVPGPAAPQGFPFKKP